MVSLVEGLAGGRWLEGLRARLQQTGWVLAHWADLDADFLAIYRIDLDDCDLTGPRFFALAHRLTAYTGVMAARAHEEEEEDRPAQAAPARSARRQAPAGDSGEVSLTAFRVQFPGLVSVAKADPEGG